MIHIHFIKAACATLLILANLHILYGADVPRVINYQGKLFLNGSPVDTTVNIKYALFDTPTGGTPLWEQNSHSVTVAQGLFTDTLGLRIDTVLATHSDLWLEISINGVTLSPREKLYSAPFAITVADSAITENKIRWGNNASEVNAKDIPVVPLENYYESNTVQDVLDEIARKTILTGTPACSSASYKLFTNY